MRFPIDQYSLDEHQRCNLKNSYYRHLEPKQQRVFDYPQKGFQYHHQCPMCLGSRSQ
ncbi:Uncharacterised protein [Vibrio cholerae]|nr:Uncharacterised protein [Vibrio cholerae]